MTALLFQPTRIGGLTLPNRIAMPPLTRARAGQPGNVPTALNATYYAQRASAGLIVAEATDISPDAKGYALTPGIHSAAQIAGWRRVTDAVHRAGGRIFLQIWHGGRACHPYYNGGAQPVGPSALAITNNELRTPDGKQPYVTPRELRDDEIPAIVAGFGKAAANARAAGFDGVEVHGANGYLLDEFLRDGANRRSGPYGGPLENRARLLLEVLDAVVGELGGDRVGLRISPLNSFNSMIDSDPVGLVRGLARRLNTYQLAYLHVMRTDFLGQQQGDVLTPAREAYEGVLVGNMGYSPAEAASAVEGGLLDAVAFGVPFIANPDLPARIKAGAQLNPADPGTFYTPGAAGYTDYPFMQ